MAKKVHKSGGSAVVNEDKSVSIIMDGKLQEVITKDDRRLSQIGINDGDSFKLNNMPR